MPFCVSALPVTTHITQHVNRTPLRMYQTCTLTRTVKHTHTWRTRFRDRERESDGRGSGRETEKFLKHKHTYTRTYNVKSIPVQAHTQQPKRIAHRLSLKLSILSPKQFLTSKLVEVKANEYSQSPFNIIPNNFVERS